MTIDLDALEKLADEATPGPWTWDGYGLSSLTTSRPVIHDLGYDGLWIDEKGPDAAFIAAANPATIKALIAELRTLQAFAADEISFAFCAGFKDAIDREKWDDCYDFAASKAGDYRNDRIRAFLARNGKGEG